MPARPKILITGSTDGHGRELARLLAADGADVLIHGRDAGKVGRVVAELGASKGYVADLSSLEATLGLADQVAADHETLEVLVNNAGVITADGREVSRDGYELGFAVNYLAHFLLTNALLDRLQAAEGGRIVNVASIGQRAIDFDDVMLEHGWDPARAYSQSKLAQIMFTFELAERLGPRPTANALHPATYMDTNMVRDIGRRPLNAVADGARATERLAVGDDVEAVTGKFFDGLDESAADPQAYDADARRRLWQLSDELTAR